MSFRLLSSSILAIAISAVPAFAKSKKESVIIPYADLKWEEYAPGVPLQVAKLWGDPAKGPHGRYLKMPAGFEAGIHSHTADYHGVLVSGTWMHWDEGKAENIELAPGSYVMQPGKGNHGDKCKEGAECVLLIVQNAKADFIPAKAPVKK
jgi:hypothetical protein